MCAILTATGESCPNDEDGDEEGDEVEEDGDEEEERRTRR